MTQAPASPSLTPTSGRNATRVAAWLLVLALGCSSGPRELDELQRGRAALERGEASVAVERLSRAIELAAAARQPYFFTEAWLARAEAHLAEALAELGPAPRPLSLKPIAPLALGSPGHERVDAALKLADVAINRVLARSEIDAESKRRALETRGRIHEVRGESGKAVEIYRAIVDELGDESRPEARAAVTRLAWLDLARVLDDFAVTEIQAEVEFAVREALRRFDRVLATSTSSEALLGRGICLARTGSYREGYVTLKRSISASEDAGTPNPLGHLYLAISIERLQGHQSEALEHLARAIGQDTDREFAKIYLHLLRSLGSFLSPGSPEFHDLAAVLLEYRGLQPQYWTEVERFFEGLVDQSDFPATLASRGLALAFARTGKIAEAIEALLRLRDEDTFLSLLDETFPESSVSPEIIYARLKTFYEIGRHDMVEELTRGELPVDPISTYYFRIRGLKARNLFERWKELVAIDPLLEQNPYVREHYLLSARRILSAYLHRFPDDVDARVCLGDIVEITGDPSAALAHFREAARRAPADIATHRRLQELLARGVLGERDRLLAWKSLMSFRGEDSRLTRYIESVREEHREKAARFCRGCGRQADEGESVCVLCGQAVGRRAVSRD